MFHVFIRSKGLETDRALLLNLSENELQKKFVAPYLDGVDIFDHGSTTRISEISNVIVLRSDLTAQDTLHKMATDHQSEIDRIK